MPFQCGQPAVRPGTIDVVTSEPWTDDGTELLERKGAGHPDSICDALAALLSRIYSAYTVEHCDGLILHHQFDKVMLIGGRTEVDFGGGRFVEPIRIVLSGRVSRSYRGRALPVIELLVDAIRDYFVENFPMVDLERNIVIVDYLTSYAGPGTVVSSTGAIANMFTPVDSRAVRGYEELVANDTSYCTAYAPLSALESAVLDVERYLNSRDTHARLPWLGLAGVLGRARLARGFAC